MPRRGSSSVRLARRQSPSGSPPTRVRRPRAQMDQTYIFGEQLKNYSMIDKKAKNSEVYMPYAGCVTMPRYKNSFSHNAVIIVILVLIALALYLTMLDSSIAGTNWSWDKLFTN